MTNLEKNSNGKSASSLELFANEIVAKNKFIKASFGGFAGSGKSRTASEFVAGAYKQLGCTKPIMVLDNEKGSRFLIPFFQKELPGVKVMLKDTVSLADVLKAMEFLDKGEIDFLFVDSLSKVWYNYVQQYKEKNRISFMQLMDWGKILPAWQAEFSDRFVNISGSIVFTGRGGFTYDKEEEEKDENGRVTKKAAFVKSGVKMKMAGETPFEPDVNIWMDQQQELNPKGELTVWREAQIMKDRSGMIDGKVFKNPTYNDFKPIMDFLCGLPTGEVSGVSDSSNMAPGENWESKNRRDQREIYQEEIEAVFHALSLGSSNDAKKLKVTILEKIFGTASWVAIGKLDLPKLEQGVLILKDFKLKYIQANPEGYDNAVKILDKAIDDVFIFDKEEPELVK